MPEVDFAASWMVLIAVVINGWEPATLQLFEEGSSYFVEHLSMAACRTHFNADTNKVVISKAFISGCSHFCQM